jgi:outer membrane protein assembly factor BamD
MKYPGRPGFTLPLIMFLIMLLAACSGKDYDPTREWTAKQFYDEAHSALNAGEFETAIRHLETLEARFPFDPYAKQAQLDVAYSYYKFDEPDSAISATERFIRLHPRDSHIDYAYYLKGLVNFNRGRGLLDGWIPRDPAQYDSEVLKSSFNDFATLVRRFPQSQYAGDAHQRMIYLRNTLAKKEIDIAEYYLTRGTWMAAANRAKNVIEKYQESSSTPRALEIMELAYNNLGLNDLASDARRVAELNKRSDTMEAAKPAEIDKDEDAAPPTVAKN